MNLETYDPIKYRYDETKISPRGVNQVLRVQRVGYFEMPMQLPPQRTTAVRVLKYPTLWTRSTWLTPEGIFCFVVSVLDRIISSRFIPRALIKDSN